MKTALSNSNYPHPLLAREGWLFIAISAVVALLGAHFWGWASLPLWIIFAFVVQFFRDPARPIPMTPNALLSPADGRIVVVEECNDPYTQAEVIKVSVFMNVFNVHSNRAPIEAKIEAVHYHPGRFLNASVDKASIENERNALLLRTSNGVAITCIQIAGLVARRILCYVKPGESLYAGQRYGFIRFGSRVDLYFPRSAQILVAVGQKVSATTSVIAVLQNDSE